MINIFNKTGTHGFSILLLFLLISSSTMAQTQTTEERVYIKIEIKGMACPYCAFGMEKELKKIAGVDNVEIELKEGLAYISTPIDQEPTKESLEKIIVDGGFTVGEIEFRDKPFHIEKAKD